MGDYAGCVTPVIVRPATKQDTDAFVRVMATAFDDTDLFAWLMPDEAKRRDALRVTFGANVASLPNKHHNNEVATIEGRMIGAAAWAEPGRWKPAWWRLALAMPRILTGMDRESLKIYGERGPKIDKATKAAHPTEPHWYLAALAVSPEAQGLGAASALVRSGQERAERTGMPIYAECELPLIPFYARHGFEVTHEVIVGSGAPDQVGLWWSAE